MTGKYLPKKGVTQALQPGVNQSLSTVNINTWDTTNYDSRTPYKYSTVLKFNEGHDVINW